MFLLFQFSVNIYCDVINGVLDVSSNGGNGHRGQDGGRGAVGRDSGKTVRIVPFPHRYDSFRGNKEKGTRVVSVFRTTANCTQRI